MSKTISRSKRVVYVTENGHLLSQQLDTVADHAMLLNHDMEFNHVDFNEYKEWKLENVVKPSFD